MTFLTIMVVIAALLAWVFAVMTGINLLTWPRARRLDAPLSTAVLVPMRDEVHNAADCVDALRALGPAPQQIIVCDDGSTDGTAAVLRRVSKKAREYGTRVEVINGAQLPPGWAGKVHACWQLSRAVEPALGCDAGDELAPDWLLYVDADTRLEPDALAHLADIVSRYDADVVTAVPLQRMQTFAEQLVMPMLHTIYASFLPTRLVLTVKDPRVLAANGQFLAIRRQALEAIGGWSALRGAVVDDMALCRRAKESGLRVVFADGSAFASCRMYTSAREIWFGFSKNIAPGLGGSALAVAGVCTVFLWAFVLPTVALILSIWNPELLLPACLGFSGNLIARIALAFRFKHPIWSGFAHAFAALYVVAMALNSLRWLRGDGLRWKGRVYVS